MASRSRSSSTSTEVRAALRDYTRVHWGARGDGRATSLVAADPRRTLVALGELVSIVYRTKKGRDRVADYHHDFNEVELPILAYEPRTTLLVIAGGMYHVSTRGIVD